MEETDLINRLRQIEDNARDALAEMPAGMPRERVRLIMGIAAHLALKLEIQTRRTALAEASNDERSETAARA